MAIHRLSSMARKRSSLPSSSLSVTSSSAAVTARSKLVSYHLLTARFDPSRLRSFLLHTIPQYCPYNDDLIHVAKTTYQSVHSKVFDDMSHRKIGSGAAAGSGSRRISGSINATLESNVSSPFDVCYQELNDCIAILSTFLSSCIEPLTPQTLSETHYLIGSINETLHQTEQAKQSYIKALWIIAANSTSDIFPIDVLATTLHCLGRTYGVLGKHNEAIRLLEKAKQHYSSFNVHKDHVVMMEVQKLIQFNEQREIDMATADSLQHTKFWSSSLSTLTLIVEDESE